MALVALNSLIDGFSGKFGRAIVFKTIRGKTFATPLARKPDKKKESTAQRETRTNFQQASQWAKRILIDPARKAYYQQRAKALRLPNAYTAALTDYMRSATLTQMRDNDDTIVYKVSKNDFTLQRVAVIMRDAIGSSETRTELPVTNGAVFKLSPHQRQTGVHLEVTDAAGRIKEWLLSDQ